MLNYKSLLYKQKYYPISFKLKYILSSNLNIKERYINYSALQLNHMRSDKIKFYSKFLFDKIKVWREYTVFYYEYFNLIKKIEYYKNQVRRKAYYRNGLLHRDNKPAYIEYDFNGRLIIKESYQNGMKTKT